MEPRKILIVDDEPFNQIGLKFLVTQSLGADISNYIDVASNGQEAVDLITAQAHQNIEYGLIYMDCSMPIMDGY